MSRIPAPVFPYVVDPAILERLEDLYFLLRSARRQLVLLCVEPLSCGDTLTVRQLAKYISSIEHGVQMDNVPNKTYRSVYTGLQADHLPVLAAYNAVTYQDHQVGPALNTSALTVLLAQTYPIATSLWSTSVQ